jgi:L-ascorbate metabolism protein UlaG (beta-lactamase superfamily)
MKRILLAAAACLISAALYAGEASMTKLLYQGHGSFRITSASGFVLYVDPFAGKGYDRPADLILVTHEHSDHNAVDLVPQKKNCRIVREKDMLVHGSYKTAVFDGITVQAVPAYNKKP